jgi:hypothetical protein
MTRKLAILGATIALAVGVLGVGTAGAATPVNAHGSLHCAITGKVKISPPMTFTASGTSTFTAKISSTSCSGTSGVTTFKGSLVATLPSQCTMLVSGFPPSHMEKVKYKGAAKYNTSTVNFSNADFTVTDPITMTVPGASGTSTVSAGSFTGQHPKITLVMDQSVSTFANNCQPKGAKDSNGNKIPGSGGLKKMSFSGGSNIDIPA